MKNTKDCILLMINHKLNTLNPFTMMYNFSVYFTFLLLTLYIPCNAQHPNKNSSDSLPNKNTISTPAINFTLFGTSTSNTFKENVLSIFQDKKNNYWIGTDGNGVFRYDSHHKLSHFTEKDGLSNNQVQTIQEDISGNIWFGTGGFTVSRYDGNKFTDLSKVRKTQLDKKWINDSNDLFFSGGSGVFRYSPSHKDTSGNGTLSYLPFPITTIDSGQMSSPPNRLTALGVYSILKDKKGSLWIGTQTKGVCHFENNSFTWITEKKLAGPAVLALFEDDKGVLWFGNNGGGLFRYDVKNKNDTVFNFTEANGLSNLEFLISNKTKDRSMARIYSVNQDKNGDLWVGTVDSGVWRFSKNKNTLTNFSSKDGLLSNSITTIYKDNNEEMWFGTNKGICKFNGKYFISIDLK